MPRHARLWFRRLAWFAALWLISVATIGIVALLIRTALRP